MNRPRIRINLDPDTDEHVRLDKCDSNSFRLIAGQSEACGRADVQARRLHHKLPYYRCMAPLATHSRGKFDRLMEPMPH